MPNTFLPLGSQKARGSIGKLITYQGDSARQYVIPTDAKTAGQISVRHLFADVNKMYRTLGIQQRRVCSTAFGSRWFSMLHKYVADFNGNNYNDAGILFDFFTNQQKSAWDAQAPVTAMWARCGRVFWICCKCLADYQSLTLQTDFNFNMPDPSFPDAALEEWKSGYEDVLESGTWGDGTDELQFSGAWVEEHASGAYGGQYHQSTGAGNEDCLVYWLGSKFTLSFTKGPGFGELIVLIEGLYVYTIDQNASATKDQAQWTSGVLSYGLHMLEVYPATTAIVTLNAVKIVGKTRSTGVAKATGSVIGLGGVSLEKQTNDPAAPTAGSGLLYTKSDNALYMEDDSGAVTKVGTGISDAPSDGSLYARLNAAWQSFVLFTKAAADLLYAAIGHGHSHGSLSGLGNDDHTQYHNNTRGDARYWQLTQHDSHSALGSLGHDDHAQYYNQTRGDARYVPLSAIKRMVLPFTIYTDKCPLTTNGSPYIVTIDRTVGLVTWAQAFDVLTKNDASNYWVFYLYRWMQNDVLASFSTASYSHDVKHEVIVSSFSPSSIGADAIALYIYCALVGSAGSLYMACPMFEVTC